ncbi:MAG: hypothetical protein ACRCUF_13380 [Aeromonas sobria]
MSKPIPVISTCTEDGVEILYPSMAICATEGNFNRQRVQLCIQGVIKQHAGHTFRAAPGATVPGNPAKRPRLQQVAALKDSGMSNKEIAKTLDLKLDTVQKYAKQAANAGLTTHRVQG